jgi:hypothetical protein
VATLLAEGRMLVGMSRRGNRTVDTLDRDCLGALGSDAAFRGFCTTEDASSHVALTGLKKND